MYVMPNSSILSFRGKTPKLADQVFLANGSCVSGDIEIGKKSSLWFNTVARADVNFIRVGSGTNIQDNTVVHVTDGGNPTIIGNDVTIGHNAIIHACTIKDLCLIGMGAIIMDGAVIQEESLVAAGAVVPPGKTYPTNSLIIGSPAKAKRQLNEKERAFLRTSAAHYQIIAAEYANQE